MQATLRAAPHAPPWTLDAAETALRALGPLAPVLARNVRRNMRAVGVDAPSALPRYFAAVARHLVDALRVYRCGADPRLDPSRRTETLRALARTRFSLDDSIEHVRAAARDGRGVILAAPHLCNYLVCLIRLHEVLPLTTYMRWSKDPRRRELKAAWFRAAGVNVIAEPRQDRDPGVRARICMNVLREGGILFITPDLALRRDAAPPVRLFDRTISLPAGPATMALRTGAALIPLFARADSDRTRIVFDRPLLEPATQRDRSRAGAAESALRQWATRFEDFVRTDPQCWFLWADKRWTAALNAKPEECTAAHTGSLRAAETPS